MEIILKYFPNLSEIQKEQFSKLQGLYEQWNVHINLISRKDDIFKTCTTLLTKVKLIDFTMEQKY